MPDASGSPIMMMLIRRSSPRLRDVSSAGDRFRRTTRARRTGAPWKTPSTCITRTTAAAFGSLLLSELIARALRAEHHAVIAGIDAEQAASVALHAKFHFERVGRLRQVGRKFGRWLDVIYMELMLDRG